MSKKNFWDRVEMNALMIEYRSMFDIDKGTKTLTLSAGEDERVADHKYSQFYRRHQQMAEVVLPKHRGHDRIMCCATHLWEVMMFKWDPTVNPNSYGFFYRTARRYSLNWLAGREDGSSSFFKKRHSTVRRNKIQDDEIPEGSTIEEFARYIAMEVLDWPEYKLSRDEMNDCWDISYHRPYKRYVSLDRSFPFQVQEASTSLSMATIVDGMDWKALSEYLPDVPASDIEREIAYVYLLILQELVEEEGSGAKITASRAFGGLILDSVRERTGTKYTRQRLADVRVIVREAYRMYFQDYVKSDAPTVGGGMTLSYDRDS